MIYILSLILIFLSSCTTNNSTTHFKGYAMTMAYQIVIGKDLSKKQQKKVNNAIFSTFKETDLIFNNWNPSSEISQINQNQSTDFLPISPKLKNLLEYCDLCHKITNERFDPTIGSIFNAWKKALIKNIYPSELELDAVGWINIRLNKLSLQKKHSKCQLDLCGISKGYTIDLLAEKLNNLGFNNFLIEWGGEVLAKGMHPKGRFWNVLVQSLPEEFNNKIHLKNNAVATSGDFTLNKWSCDEKSYSHIFDPRLKKPLEKTTISTVTVIANNCYLADALATAAMTFSNYYDLETWSKQVVKSYPEISFIIVNSKNLQIKRIANERRDFF
jgi:FAD:protein FMN transferase